MFYKRRYGKSISESNALLSQRMQGKGTNGGFNGEDYISLCDYEKRDLVNGDREHYNSYQYLQF